MNATATRWVRGTTTHTADGRAFIQADREGFHVYTTARPWGTGTERGTRATMADAKRHAEAILAKEATR